MDASSIIEQYGRGIPAILHSAMIVDVCAYMRSSQSPAALVLSDRGDVRGILTQREIIGAAGRIGSSVMQMMAGELLREQAAVCQMDTQVTEILELLSETGAECVLVCDGTTIKGFITQKDITELLASVMGAGSAPEPALEEPAQAVHEPAASAFSQPDMLQPAPAYQPQAAFEAAPAIQAMPAPPVPAMPSAMMAAYQPEVYPAAPQPVQHAMPAEMPSVAQMLARQPVAGPVMPQQPGVPMPSMMMPQVPDVPPAAAFAWPQQQPAPAFTTPQPQTAPTYAQPQAVVPQFTPAQAPQPDPQAAPAAATGMPSTAGWASFSS